MATKILLDIDDWMDDVWAHCVNEPSSAGYAASVLVCCKVAPMTDLRHCITVEATLICKADTLVYRENFGMVPKGGRCIDAPGIGAAKQRAGLIRAHLRRFGIEANNQREGGLKQAYGRPV